jgi:RNA polymerase sigma-70 factor, ECF subfamily
MRLTKVQRDELVELFTHAAPDLARYAQRLCGSDRGEAEDLVQITFQEAARAWDTLGQRGPEDRRKWLYTVLRNKAVDERRKTSRVDLTPDDPGTGSSSDPAEAAELSVALAQCWEHISRMPPQCRSVAFLAWQEQWITKEIAAHLGITPGTVRGHLHEVRKRLRAELGHLMTINEDIRNADES